MNTNYSNAQAGFIKTVILTVLALVFLNLFFGFDLVAYLDRELLLKIWHEEIVRPATVIWNWVTGIFKR